MHRRSRIALACALAALVVAWLSVALPQHTMPPEFGVTEAGLLLEAGRRAVVRRDTAALLRLTASDARIEGPPSRDLRRELAAAMRSAGAGRLEFTWSGLSVEQQGDSAEAAFSLVVRDSSDRTSPLYEGHIRLWLARRKVSRWLGLRTSYEWLVVRAETTAPLPAIDDPLVGAQ